MTIRFDMSKVQTGPDVMLEAESYGWDNWFEDAIKTGIVQRPRALGLHFSPAARPERDYYGEPSFCYRECTLAADNYLPCNTVHKPETLWNFELGWHIHEAIQQILTNAGFVDEVETTHLAKRWGGVLFTPDGIVVRNGVKYVLEIKGYANTSFDKDVDAGRPNIDAHRQANVYMGLLGPDYHQAIILEICKGKSKHGKFFKIWEVSYDESMTHEVVKRLNTIERMVKLHRDHNRDLTVLPQRLPNCLSKASKRAKECNMREACFAKTTKHLATMRRI